MESKEDATLKLTKPFIQSAPKPAPLKFNTHKSKITQQEKEYYKKNFDNMYKGKAQRRLLNKKKVAIGAEFLGFIQHEEEQEKKSNFKRSSKTVSHRFTPDSFKQSQFKFLIKRSVKDEKKVLEMLVDQDSTIEWEDVEIVRCIIHQVIFETSSEQSCAICLEKDFASPRVSKCGHIFCLCCLLQYMKSQTDSKRNWKKCPLCYDPIFLKQLKPALIRRFTPFAQMEQVQFHLMCRSRGNNIVIDLSCEQIHSHESSIPSSLFPEFTQSQILYCSQKYKQLQYKSDIESLTERKHILLGYEQENGLTQIEEAKVIVEENYEKSEGEYTEEEESLSEGTHLMEMEELVNEDHYFLFYQAIGGQNHFLLPLNYLCMRRQYGLNNLPLQFNQKILQIDSLQKDASNTKRYKQDCTKSRYLSHLSQGSHFYFLEIKLDNLISDYNSIEMYLGALEARAQERDKEKKEKEEQKQEKLSIPTVVLPQSVTTQPLGRIKFNVKEEDFEFEMQGQMKEEELAKRKDSEKKEQEVWGVDIEKGGFDIDKGGGTHKNKSGAKAQISGISSQNEEIFNADGELKQQEVFVNDFKITKGRTKKKKRKITTG